METVHVTGAPKIHAAMISVMRDCGAIGKDQKNPQQGYKFRGIDDVYNHLQKIKAKHGVYELPEVLDDRTEERQTSRGGTLIYRILKIRYTFFAEDGSTVQSTVIGEGMDSGDKAANKAMSVAHKYALIQAFNIPTADLDDPDKDTPQGKDGLRPKSDPLYTGTNPQKQALAEALKRANVTDPDVMRSISQFCMHTPMSQLPEKIREFLSAKPTTKGDQHHGSEATT